MGGVTVTVALAATPLYAAAISTARSLLPCTGCVAMAKVALLAPSGTVTLVGTDTMLRLRAARVTTASPERRREGERPLRNRSGEHVHLWDGSVPLLVAP